MTKCMSAKLLTVLVSMELLISRISLRKRIFQLNYFSLFIRGPGGIDENNS